MNLPYHCKRLAGTSHGLCASEVAVPFHSVLDFSNHLFPCHTACTAVGMTGGCHSHRLYSHSCDRKVKNFDQLFSAFSPLTTLIFGALTIDCVEFQPLTIDYVHIYGSIQKNA